MQKKMLLVKPVKCELCGEEARYGLKKEFDGKIMNFCSRSCLRMYMLMRVEGLVQTETEEKYLFHTGVHRRVNNYLRPH